MGYLPMPRRPVNERDHFVVQADRVCHPQKCVAGSFDPHDQSSGSMSGITEEKTRQKLGNSMGVQAVGVTQCPVYVKTEGLDAGNIQWHGTIVLASACN